MQRINLTDNYSISRVIKGSWQLAGGHGRVDAETAIKDMFAYFDAGVTTFDCADIYTGVESLIGQFLRRLKSERGESAAKKVQVHTKYVPDLETLGSITFGDVSAAIKRSIRRLGVKRLDLVQFHWWDFSVQQYVEVALMLEQLRKDGLISHIGLTNFDHKHTQEVLKAGVKLITSQVQYSVIDNRPEKNLQLFCLENNLAILCYGCLAGGFISEKYLGVKEPSREDIRHNRSLIKYKLIIDDMGGWTKFQKILKTLQEIGKSHGLTIGEVALIYTLRKPGVGAVIVGATNSQHLNSLANITTKKLSLNQISKIDDLNKAKLLSGDVYELERTSEKHAKIMKYNLNKEIK